MKKIIVSLVKKYGMKGVLTTLIEVISELNSDKQSYLNLLEKDLIKTLNNYERRYK